MRYLRTLALTLAVILLPALSRASLNGFARISLLEGDVQIRSEDTSEWFPASINTPLNEGDSIWCPVGGRAEIQLRNGSFVRLDQQTSLDVLALADDFQQFHLGMGHAYFRTGEMREGSFQMDLNDSSVKVYDKGRFRIDLSESGDEDISIIKGSAYVESNGQRTRVRSGEMLSIEEGNPEILPLNPPDEWERWNVERDRVYFSKRSAQRYLPDELSMYQHDLDDNGQWTYVREYGYIWRPTVIAGPDWGPYRVGRWVWRGDDYVWISYENWGWAPYHYGRWISLPSLGWCWVPPVRGEVYWAPGYVGWVSTPGYVGWVPLAPGETYYGRGNYGRNSVNVTKVNIRNITVNKVVYKNVYVNNAVTVVNRNSFATGAMSYVKPRENIFVKEKIQLGRPDIKPAKQAMMPVVRNISQAKLPPPAIRNVPFRELRERHPKIDGNPRVLTDKQVPARQTPQRNKQDQPAIPRKPGVQQPVAGTVPAVGDNRNLGEKPVSRPVFNNYPNGRPQAIDSQKPKVFEPEKRYKERIPPVQVRTVSPEPEKTAESSTRRNTGMNPLNVPQRQKAQSPLPIKPVDSHLPSVAGVAPPKQINKVEQPGSPQNIGAHLTNIPQPQRIERQGVKPPQPVIASKAPKQPAVSPVDAGNKKVWKIKEKENPGSEVKKEKKDEKEAGKPAHNPVQ